MTTKYICKRCNYNCTQQTDMLRHIKKKNLCTKKIDYYSLSDDQISVMSLLPHINDKNNIDDCEVEHLKESNLITENMNDLYEFIEKIHKNKIRTCKYCNEIFGKAADLKRHVIVNCYYSYLLNKLNENNTKDNTNITNINSDMNNSNSYNTTTNTIHSNNNSNNTINNNNNINNNIMLEIKNPVPFDEDWDLSEIHPDTKMATVFNNLMYTSLLNEILKNESNLNVIIDKKTKSGMVYVNDIDKYIKMKLKDITDRTMEKLQSQLLDINEEIKPKIFHETYTFNRRMINKKQIDYTKSNDLQEQVSECMSNIYGKKTKDAIKKSKDILSIPLEKKEGY